MVIDVVIIYWNFFCIINYHLQDINFSRRQCCIKFIIYMQWADECIQFSLDQQKARRKINKLVNNVQVGDKPIC
jgi:hypothetical protein